jgi:UDP-N-acetylglucosamine--N-acetylmuramyl-(pentapeptide) pyrophosphoryl-undecaprenol N-acetylglucosamine transferase
MLTGGGTIGAVSPLLAIKEKMEEQGIAAEYLWIGTKTGVEREVIQKENIPYKAIFAAKLRRYFSFQLFLDPFRFVCGFFQARSIIKKFQPDLILSAGGFVSVPVVIAANWLKKKTIIHQQDIVPGLANKIMARYATLITVSFEASLKDFPKEKTVQIGNPCRLKLLKGTKESALKRFSLEENLPTLLILGGSLGAEWINENISAIVADLSDVCQIIHVVGRGNVRPAVAGVIRYHQYEYLFEELADAYAVADLVIARAGLSTLTELTVLHKPAILIPIPDNQQEKNAEYFSSKNAVILEKQKETDQSDLLALIKNLLANPNTLERLSKNISDMMPNDATEKYVNLIKKTIVTK